MNETRSSQIDQSVPEMAFEKELMNTMLTAVEQTRGDLRKMTERFYQMELQEMANKWAFDRMARKTRFAGMDLRKMLKNVINGIRKGMEEGMFQSLSEGIWNLIFPLLCIFLNQGSKVDQIIEKASSKETVKLLRDGKRLFRLTNTGRIGPLAITLPRLGTLFPDILGMAQVSVNTSQFGVLAWYRAPITYAIGNVIGGRNGATLKKMHIEAKEKLDGFLKNKAKTPVEELERYAELSIQTISLNELWANIIGIKCGALTARLRMTVNNGIGMIENLQMEFGEFIDVALEAEMKEIELTEKESIKIIDDAVMFKSMKLNDRINEDIYIYPTAELYKYCRSKKIDVEMFATGQFEKYHRIRNGDDIDNVHLWNGYGIIMAWERVNTILAPNVMNSKIFTQVV
ncbi:hypothetical protein SNEBB_002124 [Seison nebaliae]|nr:hypothetical protein SNEBB_002124 [Seison nebaliae]